ncbi:MAG: GNAT family N-acetyltransferase [Anaerolineae bacterium]
MKIRVVKAYDKLDDIKQLFNEYVAWLHIDLAFQDYANELSSLPGKYAEPDGRLYIAYVDCQSAGCVALRRFDAKRCEMKRLYVRPQYRGLKLGRILAEQVIGDARSCGYTEMLLDTLSFMPDAIALYQRLGFVEIGAYYPNPIPNTRYFSMALSQSAPGSRDTLG